MSDREVKLTPGEIAREAAANAELESSYPRVDGDVVVIGPEAFMTRDGSVLCYRGHNYVPQSPQAEDHEAGIEAALRAGHANAHREAVENMIAAYLRAARPSPERDTEAEVGQLRRENAHLGKRLEEQAELMDEAVRAESRAVADAHSWRAKAERLKRDTERLMEALRDLIGWAEPSRGGQMAVRRAREALAEFSAGDTKDRR